MSLGMYRYGYWHANDRARLVVCLKFDALDDLAVPVS
jgi:hypothetical protein